MPRTTLIVQTGTEPTEWDLTSLIDDMLVDLRRLNLQPGAVIAIAPQPDKSSLIVTKDDHVSS